MIKLIKNFINNKREKKKKTTRLRVDIHRNADSIVLLASQQEMEQNIYSLLCYQMLLLKFLSDNVSDNKLQEVIEEVERTRQEFQQQLQTEEQNENFPNINSNYMQ